jgi:hypothetical protein
MKRLWLLVTLLFVMATVSCRQINIDPNSDPLAGGFSENPTFFEPLGQSFTTVSAHTRWIGVFINNCQSPTESQITLLEGSGTSGKVVATQTATAPGGFGDFLYFDFSKTPLVVGSQYTAIYSLVSASPGCATGINGTSGTVYSGGTAFSSGEAISGAFFFRALTAIFAGQVRPPLKPDGSATFERGTVIPVKFALTADTKRTCDLPPAAIGLRNTPKLGFPLIFKARFNVDKCLYTYALPTAWLPPGAYIIDAFLLDSQPTPLQVASVGFTLD